jgi:hypothetical protein
MFSPTTTVVALTQNNTSACGSSEPPCTEAWQQTHSVTYATGSIHDGGTTQTVTGFWDHPVPSGPRSPGSVEGYVSKVPMSALLPGASVPVWVETQNWWGSSGHIDNGEASAACQEADGGALVCPQIQDQVRDHLSRGIAGQVVDWYGPGTTADRGLPTLSAMAEATGGAYKFAVMIDKGYFGNCRDAGASVTCLNEAIKYLHDTYIFAGDGGSPSKAYITDGEGHPLIFFFLNSYFSEYAILEDQGVDPMGTRFILYNHNGFAGDEPPNTVGEFAWVKPSDVEARTTSGEAGTFATEPDFGLQNLTSFFDAAKNDPTAFAISETHKGFDDKLAAWSHNHIIDQQCGETWLQTFHHQGSFGGDAGYLGTLNYLDDGNSLAAVMVDTWDDYEEGTEIETGIDNCLTSLDVTLSGATLSWSPIWGTDPMNASVTGTEATIYEYSVYLAEAGGTNLMWLANVPCTGGSCGHSLDLSTFGIAGGPYVLYVQAVGYPSIVSTLSGPTSATFPP